MFFFRKYFLRILTEWGREKGKHTEAFSMWRSKFGHKILGSAVLWEGRVRGNVTFPQFARK